MDGWKAPAYLLLLIWTVSFSFSVDTAAAADAISVHLNNHPGGIVAANASGDRLPQPPSISLPSPSVFRVSLQSISGGGGVSFFSSTFFFFCTTLALVVHSGLTDGSADLLFGVQWNWSEPEEKEEQLRSLADCVTRRLDQGSSEDRYPRSRWHPLP